MQSPPSPGAFHNVDPRTREQRMATHNKELQEKNMLKTRTGNFHRYEEPGNPVRPDPVSPLYADDANRFQRDVAGEIHQQKMQALAKQQVMFDKKREEFIDREKARWEAMEAERRAEEERLASSRTLGLRGKQNRSSESFDIISLDYHQTPQGKSLQYKDEVTRYRAMLRSQNLFSKSHSVPHNIVTGELRQNPVGVPAAPQPPPQ